MRRGQWQDLSRREDHMGGIKGQRVKNGKENMPRVREDLRTLHYFCTARCIETPKSSSCGWTDVKVPNKSNPVFASYLFEILRRRERHGLSNKVYERPYKQLQKCNSRIPKEQDNATGIRKNPVSFPHGLPRCIFTHQRRGRKREVSDVAACHTCIPTTPVEGKIPHPI